MFSLHHFLERWGGASLEIEREMKGIFKSATYAKGEQLTLPGTPLSDILFICSGIVRFYAVEDDGKEWNKGFSVENTLMGYFVTGASNWPVPYGIQALEEVIALRANAADFVQFTSRYEQFQRAMTKYINHIHNTKVARLVSLQTEDAHTRYHTFLKEQPGLAARLPQYHIASYLGMSEVTLSRLRKDI